MRHFSPLKKRASLEAVKILSDGNWYSNHYLVLSAGKYIPPEIASRVKREGRTVSVESGRSTIMINALRSLGSSGRLERRTDGRTVEWRLKDFEWAKRALAPLEAVGQHPTTTPETAATTTPEADATPTTTTPEAAGVPPTTTPEAGSVPLTTIPTEIRLITVGVVCYTILGGVKQAYEKVTGQTTTWEDFLLRLVGSSLKAI